MNIRYANGQTLEAILLSGTETTMRLAVQGRDDIVVLNHIHDVWVSDDCEAVQVCFAWAGLPAADEVREENCICSHALAARLIHSLFAGHDEAEPAPPVPRQYLVAAAHQVI